MGQLQEEKKMRVSLILLADFRPPDIRYAHLCEWRGWGSVSWKQTIQSAYWSS